MARTRAWAVGTAAALLATAFAFIPAQARQEDNPAQARLQGDHTENFKEIARLPITIDKDVLAQGSDLAFKGNLVFAGSFEGTGIFKILKKKPYLRQLSFLSCAGGQGDVSVLGNFLFVSVDSTLMGPTCDVEDTAAADPATTTEGGAWEGIRIIDISNPRRPRYVQSIHADCGSHTHTLLPGKQKSYIYIQSYPISGQNPNCNYLSHRKVQIVEFPTKDPTKAELLDNTIDTSPAIGCHDITTFPDRKLMAGACVSQSMIWSIEDPAAPELLATIFNPNIQIHHSTAMTWDGNVLILGDEYTGAIGVGGCTGNEDSTIGAAWFYDVSDPSSPTELGHHSLPRVPQPKSPAEVPRLMCTNHNFNVIPLKNSDDYLLAVSYYMGGIAIVDFTDPTDPTEVAHYVLDAEVSQDTWASYWYNGRIYTNDFRSQLGVGVYEFEGTTSQKTTRFFKGEMNPQVQFDGNFR